MIIHADSAALVTWTGTGAPLDAPHLLRRASILVSQKTVASWYTIDEDGRATDAVILKALSDATCSHAAHMAAATIDPLADAAALLTTEATTRTLGPATITTGPSGSKDQAKANLSTQLCAEATMILAEAGLLGNEIVGR